MSRLRSRVSCLTVILLVAGASTRPGFGALINDYAGNISVTVSSEDSGNGMTGIKTVDGSGFGGTAPNFTDSNPPGVIIGRPEHDAVIGNLWRSNEGTVSNHFISFDLGTAYTVTNVVVWNYNQAGNVSKGIKDFKLWYSTSASPTPVANPTAPDWTLAGSYTLVNQGTGAAGYDNVDVIVLNISARHILFDVETIHAGASSDRCGLSEVQFYGMAPPPDAPTGLTAIKVSSSQIDLAWIDNSSNEDGFKIERKTGLDGTYAQIGTVGAGVTSYEDTDLSGNTEYYYQVRAYNSGGNSAYSNEANATTDPGPPAAPSALNLTPVSTSQINLSWTDNAGNETGFEIQRKTGTDAYAQIATVGENVTSYQDSGLATDTAYYYQVRATNAIGASAWCSEVGATTWPDPPTAPSALSATVVSANQIDLSWDDNSSNETGFKIERKIGVGGDWAEIATVAADVETFENTGLAANTEYVYRVRAYNAGGHSAYSDEAGTATLDDRFYVAKHGNNTTGDGSQAAPWATIQYAVTNVTSGRTILIGEGTYTENVQLTDTIHTLTLRGGHNTNDWSWSPSDHPTVMSGSSGARIQLGGDVSYNGLPSVSNTIMGLTLIGGLHGIVTPYHASIKSTVTISHCVITDQGTGFAIFGNGPCDFNIYNTVAAKADMGIYHSGGGVGGGITGTNYIFNCTFVTNRRGNVWMNKAGTTIVSNTLSYGAWRTDSEGYGIRAQDAAHPLIIGHSLVYGNTIDIDGHVTQGDGMITNQAPIFENYAGLDLRLTADSPGVDTGVTIASITDDLLLIARPQGGGYDMGAYELYVPDPPGSLLMFR